jgi:hypothetical protein
VTDILHSAKFWTLGKVLVSGSEYYAWERKKKIAFSSGSVFSLFLKDIYTVED